MGPRGSCKALVTGGGYLEVTAAGAALAARLELASPVCKYINNLVTGLADHGLYCGVFLCRLLEQQWQGSKFSKSKIIQAIAVFVKELNTVLNSDNVCVRFDFDSIQNFLPLVRTVITSKSPVLLSGMDVDRLSIEIIRVFLNCVDEETNLLNRVYTKVENGSNIFSSHQGILYTVTEIYDIEIAERLTGEIKVIVFVLKLQDSDATFSEFDKLKPILKHSINLGVKIVACQKTVSSEIKMFLRRKNVILLERMGTDFTKTLIEVSHAFPISQLRIEESDIDQMIGHLTSIEHVNFNDHDYLVLQNSNSPVGTLLIQTSSLLREDYVKEDKKEEESRLVATWVQRAMQSTCSAVELDTVYLHGWGADDDCCGCRLLRRGDVERAGGSWLTLREVVESQVSLHRPRQLAASLRPDVLVESHHQKVQVIHTVFESFANLSDIGLIVYDS